MEHITAYFDGEKLQCLVGAISSVTLIAATIYFLFRDKAVLKGFAYSALPISVLLLIICVSVILRTPGDIDRVSNFYHETPKLIQTDEIPRMERVMNSFSIIKKVEIALFVIGLLIIVLFRQNELAIGIAIGLIVMSSLLYLFDHLAESRGEVYLRFLNSL